MKTLASQVILTSGAADGIGSATARLLVKRGAHVVLADLDENTLKQVAAPLGTSASTIVMDVTDPASCAAGIATVLHERAPGVVWADAGISAFGPMELLDNSHWRRVVEVNLLGAYNLVHALSYAPQTVVYPTVRVKRFGSAIGKPGSAGKKEYTN